MSPRSRKIMFSIEGRNLSVQRKAIERGDVPIYMFFELTACLSVRFDERDRKKIWQLRNINGLSSTYEVRKQSTFTFNQSHTCFLCNNQAEIHAGFLVSDYLFSANTFGLLRNDFNYHDIIQVGNNEINTHRKILTSTHPLLFYKYYNIIIVHVITIIFKYTRAFFNCFYLRTVAIR